MHAVRRWQWILSTVLVVAVFLACDDAEKYEIVTDCTEDAKVATACIPVGADAGEDAGASIRGFASYTCAGSAIPTDSNPTLVCNSAHPGQNDETIFCCAASGVALSTCSADSTVACGSGETGYYCSGSDTPSQADPTLECSSSVNATGGFTYCCAHEGGASGCTADVDAGCAVGATGYDCPASVSPSDPSLSCSSPTVASNGDGIYCCTAH